MSVETVGGRGAVALAWAERAAKALGLSSQRAQSLLAEAERLAAEAVDVDALLGTDGLFSITFDSQETVGVPVVVHVPATDVPAPPGPFLPVVMGGKIVPAPLAKPVPAGVRATALVELKGGGNPVVHAVYAGEALERLGEAGFELALDPEGAQAKLIIDEFAAFLLAHVRPLHDAMECFGFSCPRPGRPFALVGLSANAAVVTLTDLRDGKPFKLEVGRNGGVFCERRRYDSRLCKLGLADPEILRTGIVSIEVGDDGNSIDIIFMGRDTRPAHLTVHADKLAEPVIAKTIPDSALDAMCQRPAALSLKALALAFVGRMKQQGRFRMLVSGLLDSHAKQAQDDMKLLAEFASIGDSPLEDAKLWASNPDRIVKAIEALARHLPEGESEGDRPRLRMALSVAIGRTLAGSSA